MQVENFKFLLVGEVVYECELTDDLEVAELGFGCGCVDLAHVSSPVFFLHVRNVQVPRPVVFVRDCDPGVPCDDVTVNCKDGRLFKVHPSHLKTSSGRHERVVHLRKAPLQV